MGNDGGDAAGCVDMKIVMVGDIGVGKTCVAARFIRNQFTSSGTTIGASYMCKEFAVNDTNVKFSLWDTAGQEQYHSLVPVYFRSAAAVVLMYDITSADSLGRIEMWEEKVREAAPADVIIAVVGNKSDLGDKREVSLERAEAMQKQLGAQLLREVSAKNSDGVFELFDDIASTYLETHKTNPGESAGTTVTPGLPKRAEKADKGCKC
eukprot:TRINITY_DN7366_c0_g1_i1.p1 TRINITY_DN7366_c0_g1~~TRINITY_DN7366_c0_g1_i1.p1  ORF type:complete len:208 (+),score=75.67 TRINITY_DN7366_c0_g1_i1:528-1151(+)